ncbi:MAG TPA: PfkB family carbohydrate kinase [Trebonia sp.]|nr:PfkB family carbohydrate kinase [Trebonia sp.]
MPADVVVAGQLARDLVLVLKGALPEAGQSGQVRERREMLGGKGANQAVALAQLGLRTALIAVAGNDEAGSRLLQQAARDGIDVSGVARRTRAATGLIVDIVDRRGQWRYLEDLPRSVLLNESDVRAGEHLFRGARWASVQLQQPAAAVRAAARLARQAGCRVLIDGAPPAGISQEELLSRADVVRADAREAELLAGKAIAGAADAAKAAEAILRQGAGLVALAVGDEGNYLAWDDPAWGSGELLLPLTGTRVVDTTGAGDAFTAALIKGLDQYQEPEAAAHLAVAAAGTSVGHPGGRPELTWTALEDQLARLRDAEAPGTAS